ncbi:Uma2 family endonuclease [Plectonema cf. radiosum LEGE 06105]|uniref:Uma2 family endonuclease n=1 Tax=Plectonema cf. radiosum LEGE 06105 TaxID=945769 RepID=A0A8J7K4K3_9CYAN|nr:Uma2 family endonuclease [Plectonema radiosum]MBE9214752.1 Uma2 family endonuclease [Plectonema cf. radiosum LEGE 06105]
MVASPQQNYITPEEYLQLELESDVKHEYIDGYAYAMAGANDAHVTVSLNLATLLRSHVRGSGCRVYISDMKARIEKSNRYYYPDIMITCDERDKENTTEKKFPCLIVEVLSDSTEAFDRGDKFADYQLLETLQEYVLINVKRQRIECFRRNNEGLWVLQSYTFEDEYFQLQSINFEGEISGVYEDVVFG